MPPGSHIGETPNEQVQPVRWRPERVRTRGQVTLWTAMVVMYTKHERILLVCLNVTIHVRGARRGPCVWDQPCHTGRSNHLGRELMAYF